MANGDEIVTVEIKGKTYNIRKRLKDALEGKGKLDDEFRATFTDEEKAAILSVLVVGWVKQ